jgi:hypothetical protein
MAICWILFPKYLRGVVEDGIDFQLHNHLNDLIGCAKAF